jgi:uncharacterized protein YggE
VKLVVTCILITLSSFCAIAQEHPTVSAQPNSVFVGADGKFETAPDTATIQFVISAQEDSSRAAFDRASRAAEQIRQILRTNNVDPKTAEIGSFSIDPVYDYKNPKRKLIAYRVDAGVTLKLKDFMKLATILEQLSGADITENQSMSYTLDNMDLAKEKAVEDAYRRARESAEVVARVSGRVLGELSYASVDTFENIRPIRPMAAQMKMSAQAMMPAPTEEFSPQSISVTAHVNAMFALK